MKKTKCAYCGEIFTASRRTAKFCCDEHRAAFHYAKRTGRLVPDEDDQPARFRWRHRFALRVLRETSPRAAAGLDKIMSEYGVEVAETVFQEIVAPVFNEMEKVRSKTSELLSSFLSSASPEARIMRAESYLYNVPISGMNPEDLDYVVVPKRAADQNQWLADETL